MKHLIAFALLLVIASSAIAQTAGGLYTPATLLKTHTTYVNSSDDTTGWITVKGGREIMDAREVTLFWVATDSVQATIYVIGNNSRVGALPYMIYEDSISTILSTINGTAGFAARPYFKAVSLKGPGYDRIPGCTRFKVGTMFSAAGGTRAGRTCKLYLYWKP